MEEWRARRKGFDSKKERKKKRKERKRRWGEERMGVGWERTMDIGGYETLIGFFCQCSLSGGIRVDRFLDSCCISMNFRRRFIS
jgi:hypothetical protein